VAAAALMIQCLSDLLKRPFLLNTSDRICFLVPAKSATAGLQAGLQPETKAKPHKGAKGCDKKQ
jgi:hypothetical protein